VAKNAQPLFFSRTAMTSQTWHDEKLLFALHRERFLWSSSSTSRRRFERESGAFLVLLPPPPPPLLVVASASTRIAARISLFAFLTFNCLSPSLGVKP
jgi:hypothetical protein